MALDLDIQFIDQSGDNIEGSCEQAGREGLCLGNAFEHEVRRPYSSSSGKATGRVSHGVVRIWKEIDKASPILAQALYYNTRLQEVRIRFWKPAPDGTENNYYSCTLEGVRIQSHTTQQLHNRFENGKDMSVEAFDVLALTYEQITYTFTDGGIQATGQWNARGRRS